ncbi:MAG TPA: class I SAM-dependent DNA methyltransferase [Balneolaceae bacterium]|nr:class I SAM-dependent DNA methyltransferase [Balneolaceae bacterium]
MNANKINTTTLENWLWDAACKIRGPVDAPKYKDYILPLIFIKRLSDVFEDELEFLSNDYGDRATAEAFVEEDHSLVRVYIPKKYRWSNIKTKSSGLGEFLTDVTRAIARENARLEGVVNIVDFNATTSGQRIISDEALKKLIDVLSKHRLGLDDVEPDIIGRAYEYLLRKFAEGSGQSAGEFYTPKEVAILMSHILDPEPGETIYDPTVGSAGLLIKCKLRFDEKFGKDTGKKPLQFFGQEIQPSTYAMSKMNTFIHDMQNTTIKLGDTMHRPGFLADDTRLQKFDIVTANPMWNQKFDQATYENDTYGRFTFGYPPNNTADWGWVQHMHASLNDKGRMAIVLDTGAVSRGSGNVGKNKERDIRKKFVEEDLIEAVFLMPENMFYNTSAPGIIMVINRDKPHPEEILLVNASHLYSKGKPKNYLEEEHIKQISEAYLNWQDEEELSKIISLDEASKNDFNLSPSRYVSRDNGEEVLPLDDAVVLLEEAEEERAKADDELKNVLKGLGF